MHLILVSRGNPFITLAGTEIFVKNLVIELSRHGHRIDLIYGVSDGGSFTNDIKNIKAHELRLIKLPYIRALDFRRRCLHAVKDLIEGSEIEAVISIGAGTFAGYLFRKIKHLKLRPISVYYAVDSMVAEYERIKITLLKRSLMYRIKTWVWYKALINSDRLSCSMANMVIASCRDTADRIVKDYDVSVGKIKVVYFGLPDNFSEGYVLDNNETPTFLHISTVPERKGTVYFLEAMKILQEKYNIKTKAIIAGSRDPFYIDLAKKLDVDAVFIGKISHHKLKKYYASCTALISPSLSEGFCLPVIEAMMFSKPAIASKAGSLSELIDDGIDGYTVPVADVSSLAERMYMLATDNELRRRMSLEARKKAEKFKISIVAENLIRILEEV